MPVRACEACGRSFTQGRSRPARFCPDCRPGGGRYGGEHRKLRESTIAEAYGQPCSRCGRPMVQGQDLHLDHDDSGDPSSYLGFSHAVCNTTAPHRTVRVNGFSYPALEIPPARNPDIPHRPDCRCGAMRTSRCW
jgi:hypothetical protein